jgi:hypothetical protein
MRTELAWSAYAEPAPPLAPQVYTGFRVAPKGAQEAYGVQADIVTYGKTLGGGLPVGVCCGGKKAMTRSDPEKAARVAYVIGTFAGHPAVRASRPIHEQIVRASVAAADAACTLKPRQMPERRAPRAPSHGASCALAAANARGGPRGGPITHLTHMAACSCRQVMGSMNAFLKWHSRPETRDMYGAMHTRIEDFITKANKQFKTSGYPLKRACLPHRDPRAALAA